MKKFFAFFVMLYHIIIDWFKNKSKKETLAQKFENAEKAVYSNNPVIPQHNNRKVTRGRFVQYINVGENRTRAIYHGAK
jgi:hypothetical protein